MLQKATSYDGASSSSKKLRISPTNELTTSPALQFRNGDANSQNKTDRNWTLCFGNSRRKRRRLQFTGATRGGSNGNGGTEVTYPGVNPVSRQFTITNQR